MARSSPLIWKRDPDDASLLHSIAEMAWGEGTTHCGKVLEVTTAKSRKFGTYDKRCPSCEARR